MTKTSIAQFANKVWELLSNHQVWSYQDLKRESGLADRELNAAIGWLAHEGLIDADFRAKASTTSDNYRLTFNQYY